MSDQPKTLTAAEVLGAIDSLDLMIESGGGDVDAKATLALTTYRVAARTNGLVWADGRFGPIFTRLREQAVTFGRQAQVETIRRVGARIAAVMTDTVRGNARSTTQTPVRVTARGRLACHV